MPPPAPLLDESKYVSLPRSSQQQQQQQQQHYGQGNSSRSPHHHNQLHRPYSFTSGMLPDNVNQGHNLGRVFVYFYFCYSGDLNNANPKTRFLRNK